VTYINCEPVVLVSLKAAAFLIIVVAAQNQTVLATLMAININSN
jgi:hypothetical protein